MASLTLYDDDIVAWAEQQAAALRSLAEREPKLSNTIDWHNVVDEIETVGRTQIRSAVSASRQFFVHLIKAFSDPNSDALAHWRTESVSFLSDLRNEYTPSMRQHIDLGPVWRDAKRIAASALTEYGVTLPETVPSACPFSIDELAAENFEFDSALARLQTPGADPTSVINH